MLERNSDLLLKDFAELLKYDLSDTLEPASSDLLGRPRPDGCNELPAPARLWFQREGRRLHFRSATRVQRARIRVVDESEVKPVHTVGIGQPGRSMCPVARAVLNGRAGGAR
jgi:hypothetical protein